MTDKAALKREMAEFFRLHPGADQLDAAEHCRVSLQLACDCIRELVDEGKLRPRESQQ